MTPKTYLQMYERERVPEWLNNYSKDSNFNCSEFFKSRVVFYPGSGNDGHAVEVFGASHSAHCFVYSDYMLGEDSILDDLNSKHRSLKGYNTFAIESVNQTEISPSNWRSHLTETQRQLVIEGFSRFFRRSPPQAYGMFVVFERDEQFDNTHGPERLAILFLGADGHATFDALFCQDNQTPPFAVLLQDHGFGGNYCDFGEGGIMQNIASRTNRLPKYLLVSSCTKEWPDYELVNGLEPTHGGWASFQRNLFINHALP
jgi:hypothetical protein